MNKQILTDIVNSILGLSKKKKKEFIELLDDGINGVSEQLNETVEQINQKINNIEPSDFEENDENAASYIKNRPFYDYETYGEQTIGEKTYTSSYTYSSYIYNSNKLVCLYIKNYDDIQLGVMNYQGTNTINLFEDNRYKIDFENYVFIDNKKCYKIVNYFDKNIGFYNGSFYIELGYLRSGSNSPISSYTMRNIYAYFDGEENYNNLKILSILEGTINSQTVIYFEKRDYNEGKLFSMQGQQSTVINFRYYKNPEIIEHFKSLDEKYIPNSLIQRIEACEQALNITPNP